METVILRILSFIMTVIMFFTNLLSSVFPWIKLTDPIIPSENSAFIFDAEMFSVDADEEYTIAANYYAWCLVADEDAEELQKYDKEYFKSGNVVLIPVTLPGSNYYITVDSVEANNETVFVEYTVVNNGMEGTCEEIEMIILVETGKSVDTVKLSEKEATLPTPEPDPIPTPNPDPEPDPEPVPDPILGTMNGYNYGIFSSDNFDDDNIYNEKQTLVSDYETWASYFIGSEKNLQKYDAKYFAEKSLAIFYVPVPDVNKTILLTDIVKSANSNTVFVDYRIKNSEITCSEKFWAVVIEVDKNIEDIYTEQVGFEYGYDVQEIGAFNQGYIRRENEKYTIISDYETWKKAINSYYYADYSLTKEFFEDSSVALVTVMFPNENYYVGELTQKENGNTLEINYTSYYRDYSNRNIAVYQVIISEISKDISHVTITDNTLRNNYKTVPTSSFDIPIYGTVMLISDYEDWKKTVQNSIPALSRYTEEYFEKYSVVLIAEVYNDLFYDAEVIKIHENGKTAEIIYGINTEKSGVSIAIVDYVTILVEVSKNINDVSVERKNRDNVYKQFSYSGPFSISEDTVIISDYETWTSCVTKENDQITCYDEAYFETQSVVITKVTTPCTDGNVSAYYIYENGNTLEMGYKITNNSMFPAVGYKTVLIEVSKDVTEVNIEELK